MITTLQAYKLHNLTAPERGLLTKLEKLMLHEYQKTYMDYQQGKSPARKPRLKQFLALLSLFAMYVAVSTLEYQDCVRGAISC